MAIVLLVIITVLLPIFAEVSSGPKCRIASASVGWNRVECCGQYCVEDLTPILQSNISHLTLKLHSTPREALDFQQFTNLTHLTIQTEDIQPVLNNITGLDRLLYLNLSSNYIQELPDISHLIGLEELDLSNNSLNQVDFRFLPSAIRSINLRSNHIEMHNNVTLPTFLTHLDLSINNMVLIQPVLSETLIRLNLSGNNISDLTFVLSLFTVEELDLSGNNISQLEDDTFVTLSSLIRLDLSRNYIKSLKEKSFSGLNRLQIIDLSHNLLQSITPGTFQYLSNLLWLNLANNTDLVVVEDSSILLGAGQKLQTVDASRTNLTKIPNTLTSSIRNLYLSCNRISTIRCGDLDSFLLLQFLDLASNNISVVEDDAIGRLELLYYLLLSENSLAVIPHSLPDNLLVLDLDHNQIQNLSISDFFGLSKLKTLRLAWNRVTNIQEGAFGQLSSLQNLDLSGNPIRILSGSTFVGPRRLINLSLASLSSIRPTNDTLSFPVPESSHLQVLNLENSPALVVQLMNDVAALSMFRHITVLNLAFSRISTIRPDLINFFPRLQVLDLRGNRFNCTDIVWLSDWLRKLDDDTLDESRLQSLEETDASRDNRTDFDVTQHIDAYKNRLKASSSETEPRCASPDHLAGTSLYQLRSVLVTPAPAPTHKSRYDRANYNIRKSYDHEFYQNDFPSPARDQSPLGGRRQAKRSNSTDKTNDSLTGNLGEPDSKRNASSNRDTIKAEYLRSDTNTYQFNVTNSTSNRLENKNNMVLKKERERLPEYSPLDVAMHDNDKSEENDSDNTLSVSSPQRISVDEELDVTKDALDDDDDDADEASEERYTHHPGLVVFLVAAIVLGVTALAMRASQRRQNRLGYAQQQDIEVRSLDLSSQELW